VKNRPVTAEDDQQVGFAAKIGNGARGFQAGERGCVRLNQHGYSRSLELLGQLPGQLRHTGFARVRG
jgi:hypothetical protein